MKGLYTIIAYAAFAFSRMASGAYTTEMALCADMCPSSPLVAEDGVGISKCFDACKRLIHRVKYGDVMDSTDFDGKVKAPKESALKRIRHSLGIKSDKGTPTS
ncbi:cyclosome subunit, putative [Babesia caballi]|uniref:Cyclosome subunit, putative n=1 Tax=Babesia caballi TaxID=5871 RepID=A0AAV4M276_BABCB|nr:cyclosome subunit, putative [Babesia caballi]